LGIQVRWPFRNAAVYTILREEEELAALRRDLAWLRLLCGVTDVFLRRLGGRDIRAREAA
jgi:hypothetical protein